MKNEKIERISKLESPKQKKSRLFGKSAYRFFVDELVSAGEGAKPIALDQMGMPPRHKRRLRKAKRC